TSRFETSPGAQTTREGATWPRRRKAYCAIYRRNLRTTRRWTCGSASRNRERGRRPEIRNRVYENFRYRAEGDRRLIKCHNPDEQPGSRGTPPRQPALASQVWGCFSPGPRAAPVLLQRHVKGRGLPACLPNCLPNCVARRRSERWPTGDTTPGRFRGGWGTAR